MTDQIFENKTESVFEAMQSLLVKKYGIDYLKKDTRKHKKKRQKKKRRR